MLIVIVMGSYQGMVLPVFFTQENAPTLLGYVLSAMSVGALVGLLGYAKFAYAMKRHTWYVVSFVGMAIGIAALGSLASYGVILAGAAMLGLFSGPVSALFGYFVYGLIPDGIAVLRSVRENSMLLVVAPVAVFATSIVIEIIGVGMTSLVLALGWILLTLYALAMKAMREI